MAHPNSKTCNGSKTTQRQDTERLMCNWPMTMQFSFLSASLFFKSPDWSIMWQCPRPAPGELLFYSLIWPIRGCATGQGMVFYLSVLNREYIFVRWRICRNYKQDIACTIDCLYCKYTKAMAIKRICPLQLPINGLEPRRRAFCPLSLTG